MAHHNRTPQSILDAPKFEPVLIHDSKTSGTYRRPVPKPWSKRRARKQRRRS